MFKKILLIAIFFASSALCQQRQIIGCFNWNLRTKSCTQCLRRKINLNGVCGPLLPVLTTAKFTKKWKG